MVTKAKPKRVRWGVLGVAKIATEKVIPGMQQCKHARVTAIASRSQATADRAARALRIPRAYGSYDALITDENVDAIYIPLPNHLHLEWAIKAARAGKHVLCEKPIALRARDVERLIEVRDNTGVLIEEAFMYRGQPVWQKAMALSNSEAADLLGISVSTWNAYKAGASIPGAIAMLCRAARRDPILMQAHYRPRRAGRQRKSA